MLDNQGQLQNQTKQKQKKTDSLKFPALPVIGFWGASGGSWKLQIPFSSYLVSTYFGRDTKKYKHFT